MLIESFMLNKFNSQYTEELKMYFGQEVFNGPKGVPS